MSDTFPVRNPRTGQIDTHINVATVEDVKNAALLARKANADWLALGLSGRADALMAFASILETRQSDIITALEQDTGRRRIAGQEVAGVIASLRGWAQGAPHLLPNETDWTPGRMKPHFKHRHDYVPYKLVGVISPWNFPMTLSFIDTTPALMAGACVIVKPSEVTPRFAEALRPIIAEAGLGDVLRFIQGAGETGAALVSHADFICFTGSVPTGRKVALGCAERLIPCNLELGGKDPLIIAPGTDIEAASALALRSSVLATGQACQSIERVYVHQDDHDAFVEALIEKAKVARLNTTDICSGDIGPFIDGRQAEKVLAQIKEAVSNGARLHCGGKVLNDGGGHWIAPTVLTAVTHDMEIMREETFGPVIPVMAYSTIEEAITLANDTAFGLSAGVFAKTLDEAYAIGQNIHAGAISLQDAALTGQYFEAGKQSFGQSGLGASRMGADGYLRFFRKRAFIANTASPLALSDFAEEG
jgi:acyl-CoA reductase-like NAD-dependent aldehyde dehydrogenase